MTRGRSVASARRPSGQRVRIVAQREPPTAGAAREAGVEGFPYQMRGGLRGLRNTSDLSPLDDQRPAAGTALASPAQAQHADLDGLHTRL